jgi:hypothetical protein
MAVVAEAPPNEQQLPPAGWYEDPVWRKGLRYWDGSAWTEELQYAASPEVVPPASPAGPPRSGRKRKRGPSIALALTFLFGGLGVAAPGGVGTAAQFSRSAITAASIATPGTQHIHLQPGRYRIYEKTGTSTTGNGFPFGDNGTASLTPEEVVVAGAHGERPHVNPSTDYSETVTRGTAVYTSAASFTVTKTDDYTIAVTPPSPGRALVARSLRDTAVAAAVWIALAAVGLLLSIIGVVLLIIGIVRRRNS